MNGLNLRIQLRTILFGIAVVLQGTVPMMAAPAGTISLFNGKDLSGWIDVNTSPETWYVKDGLLICKGKPIGVMRSEKQYENFLLHVEWRHMEPGGNSGIFAWSDALPFGNRPAALCILLILLCNCSRKLAYRMV